MHRYTNMDHEQDYSEEGETKQIRDEMVPLKDCNENQMIKAHWHNGGIRKYCPDFRDDDYIYGDYYSNKFSWYRLVIHTCNVKEREEQGKTCKSQEEIDAYFRKNIVGIDQTGLKAGLTDFKKEIPLFENKMDLHFTVKPDEGLTKCHDVFLQRNTIELDDDGVGFIDETKEYDYLNPLYV